QPEVPAWVSRGVPSPQHAALEPLAGTWRVEMSLYIGPGTRERPAVSTDLLCRRAWGAGGRYLQDVTEGAHAGGPYWRPGRAGHRPLDGRHQCVPLHCPPPH